MESKIQIFTDGGSRGNPGPAACAFIVKNGNGKIVFGTGKLLGQTTNNVAEYSAIIDAFSWLLNNEIFSVNSFEVIDFYSDSQLIVNQLKGIYKIKEIHLQKLAIKVKSLECRIHKKCLYNLIPREKNFDADKLVNQTLDKN
jgi:ribonuclease HI